MKILIIGLGSIGQRHLKILQTYSNIQLAAFRTNKGELKNKMNIKEFFNLNDALAFNPHGVIISNPTTYHVESALSFLKIGCKVLIEKPISSSHTEAQKLKPYKDKIRVAYCLRFHQLSDFVLDMIDINKIYKVSFKRSFYLPKWHPYADYSKEYTANKIMGGGVIRTLSHELDLAMYWFGKPKSYIGVVDRLSNLKIDVDDFALISLKMGNNCRINFELDFFSPYNVNQGELFNDYGKYEWDMAGIYFTPYTETEKKLIKEFDSFETIYQKQIDDFLLFVEDGKSKNCVYQDALNIVELINSIESKLN